MAEHVEIHEVSQQISDDIAATSRPVVTEEWDAAWDSDEKESPHPKTGSGTSPSIGNQKHSEIDDDVVDDDAWGWGDETTDSTDQSKLEENQPEEPKHLEEDRNHAVTLKENYWTSSMPKHVYDTIVNIYEDGVKLAKTEDTPSKLLVFHIHITE